MKMYYSLLLIFLTFSTCHVESAILSWIWDRGQKESTTLVSDGVPLISIPYESLTDDEKFLQEAAKFTEMQVSSPLETCYHKVVMKIRSSCNEMSEEDLAKLSVNLLNCQSLVEGRKIYPCTQDMSLKQCTTEMDADMWNAYHLMSNRARAVCYSARNLQFRALTELTVNKLVQTTHSQIKALENLQENQEKLEKETMDALSLIESGNKKLLDQHNLVASNLRELTMEKALIRLGHAKLVTMTEDIKDKLVKANDDILKQESDRKINHQEVMDDLLAIQDRAQKLWERLESSTNNILQQNQEAANQYIRTLEQLEQINKTVNFVWNLTNMMHTQVDEKLGWITDYISSTGLQMQKVYRTFLHIIYILTAMIVAGFLQAPFLMRVTIMGIIPLNLTAYLKHGMEASLDFFSITALIILITMMHYVMIIVQYIFGPKKTESKNFQRGMDNENKENGVCHNSSNDMANFTKRPFLSAISSAWYSFYNRIHYTFNTATRKILNIFQSLSDHTKQSILQQEELSCSYMSKKYDSFVTFDSPTNISDDLSESDFTPKNSIKEDNLWTMRQRHNISRSKTPMDSSGYGNRCCELTRSGKPCRGKAMKNLNYCRIHLLSASPPVKI